MSPDARLAFSIVENPGVYALLLGSGISRAASIPTGWEITLDLARRAAAAEGVSDRTNWRAWHVERFGEEPGYSGLLDRLTSTASERRTILQHYIEPDADDEENGRRVPTKAHHAIARLVKGGFVRVVVTTNFDRLLETALVAAGVEPVVVKSIDDLSGASPMQHCRCFVLKVHGDYLDNRILNTDAELAGYPRAYDDLLDRILDEYGLIVAGWSGDWDPALRAALARAPSRRYPTYWATYGAPSTSAADLIAARAATIVPIEGADGFLHGLAEAVEAIAKARRPSPETIELVLAETRRNLSGPDRRIELADGIHRLLVRLTADLGSERLPRADTRVSGELLHARWRIVEGLGEPLARAVGLLGRWGDGSDFDLARDVVREIHGGGGTEGLTPYGALSAYPAYLCVLTYALGLVAARRWNDLHRWLQTKVVRSHRHPMRIVDCLFMQKFADVRPDWWNVWSEHERPYTAWADHMVEKVVPWSADTGTPAAAALANYHLVEILGGMEALSNHPDEMLSDTSRPVVVAYGQTAWLPEESDRLMERLDLAALKPDLLAAGLCDGSETRWQMALANLARISSHLRW